METENNAIVALSILALLISIVAIGFICFDQPEKVDLSDFSNSIALNKVDIMNLQYAVDKIDTDCDCEITQSDLNELEDDLEEYCDDEIEDECDCVGEQGIPGINGTDANWSELEYELCQIYPDWFFCS